MNIEQSYGINGTQVEEIWQLGHIKLSKTMKEKHAFWSMWQYLWTKEAEKKLNFAELE
jgi:hypothetical protein